MGTVPDNKSAERSASSKIKTDAVKLKNAASEEISDEEFSDSAERLGSKIQKQVHDHAENLKEKLSDKADALGAAIEDTTEKMGSRDRPLTHYASELSTHFANLSDLVEHSSLDTLATRARHAATNNPTLFVLGGFAAGFAVSRFLKAGIKESDDTDEPGDHEDHDRQSAGDA